MIKCDVCGKKSLFPEQLGRAHLCKICFMKLNGPLWKSKTYERYEDVEKERRKIFDSARKKCFPPVVLDGINDFFDSQVAGMKRCNVCGELVHRLYSLGKSQICLRCFSKINVYEWNQSEYLSNDIVERNRDRILKIAAGQGFPEIVIDDINSHFDSKIQKGLIEVFDGGEGQVLKVYETHCVIITNDECDIEELSEQYNDITQKKQPKKSILSNIGTDTLIKGVLTGGVVRTGLSLATSLAVNAAKDSMVQNKETLRPFKVIEGSLTVNYRDFDCVDYQKIGTNDVGYLRFGNSQFQNEPSKDVIFFFNRDNACVEKLYSYISEKIIELHNSDMNFQNSMAQSQTHSISVADEILKFKNLLDMGVITKEEFEAKKKELLDM